MDFVKLLASPPPIMMLLPFVTWFCLTLSKFHFKFLSICFSLICNHRFGNRSNVLKWMMVVLFICKIITFHPCRWCSLLFPTMFIFILGVHPLPPTIHILLTSSSSFLFFLIFILRFHILILGPYPLLIPPSFHPLLHPHPLPLSSSSSSFLATTSIRFFLIIFLILLLPPPFGLRSSPLLPPPMMSPPPLLLRATISPLPLPQLPSVAASQSR